MIFNTGAALLDAVVLSVVSREVHGTYGYKITHDVQEVISVSESTLYPVLRRLLKDGCLETYDQEYQGRNRRYYQITELGRTKYSEYLKDWDLYKEKIDKILLGGTIHE